MISGKNAAALNKKILIINPFGIGDVLFTTPVIRALKEVYPDSIIGYWSNLRVRPLIESNLYVNKVFALSRGDIKKLYEESFFKGFLSSLKLVLGLKKERFNICLDFSLDHRYSLLAKIVGIKRRIGFNYKNRGRFLTDKIDISGYNDKHAVEYYLDLLKFLNITPKQKDLELNVPESSQAKLELIFKRSGVLRADLLIGIAPGAGGSWGKDASYKHWPALKFAQVADRLVDNFKAKVILFGDESENPIADVIANAMRNKPVDLVGKISLELLPAAIKKCGLFISNDGGPMHMAVALGVKTVSVFGPVDEVVYGPYPDRRNHAVLIWNGACRPCYKNFRVPVCERDKECLKAISVEEVYKVAERLLNENTGV